MVHPNFKLADPTLLLSTGWINDTPAKSAAGRAPFAVVDPATGEAWANVEAMDEVDTDAAIAAAAAAFPSFSAISARQRARMILELDRLVREHKEDLAILGTMETGKALAESRAEVDYAGEFEVRRRAVGKVGKVGEGSSPNPPPLCVCLDISPHDNVHVHSHPATYSWLMAGEAERIQGETQKANDNPSLRFFTQKVPIGPVALLCP
jgi:succinate-semialdehyde dehydrogenase